MTKDIVVIGSGGFGREVIDVIDAINAESPTWSLVGVVDDAPSAKNVERLAARGVEIIGTTDELVSDQRRCDFVVGIGAPRTRRLIAERLEHESFTSATLVHPAASYGFGVTLGAGTILCAGARLTTNISLGRHVHVNLNVTIGHDTTIGDFVSMNPLASISGDCTLHDDVLIGVAGVVLNGLAIGPGSTVGGSACVVRDVPSETVVKGVPAR